MNNLKDSLIRSVENNCGWDAYQRTQTLLNVNVSKDVEYQRNFVYFYKVRRNANWRQKFFEYMQDKKFDKNVSFEEVLKHLYSFRKSLEPSFASKLLATINDKMPIWDKNVIVALGIDDSARNTINGCVEIYNKICEAIKGLIQTQNILDYIWEFDNIFPNCKNISDVKKVDYLLWYMGKNNDKII